EFLELIAAVEATAQRMSPSPRMVFTGYLPPLDRRLPRLLVTPDPGVLEVNLPPSDDIHSAARMLRRLYQHADRLNLRAHRYEHNGLPRGSGGGHHITLGGPTPARSIFLREPALLRSMITYFQHHPALSYLFAGRFIGPTSQAPRVDEAREETLTELELAFKNLPDNQTGLLWEAGRRLGHLLVDVTGNTHRSEFCVDKLFPEAPLEMRLGLLELRAFESLPTADMTIVLYILIRALATHLHQSAYHHPFRRFGQTLHDHFLLPHFLEQDLLSVLGDLKNAGFYIPARLFQPHYEFRFPLYARLPIGPGHIEIRQALECWNVLGSDPGHSTARPVDASLDRLEIKLIGLPAHFLLICNRQYVPLLKLEAGNRIGAVRFKARRPPTGTLHPWMPVHTPLYFRVIDTDSHPYQSIAVFSYYEDYSELPPPLNRAQTDQTKAGVCLRSEDSRQRIARRLVVSNDMEPVTITPEMLASQIMNHTDDAVTLDLRFTS
ncbi:MAG: transglutaminase family protein, partial [Leptospiraceae bacterium]|nr:transglutaminase family protein [Leptospiraceae bacterium]